MRTIEITSPTVTAIHSRITAEGASVIHVEVPNLPAGITVLTRIVPHYDGGPTERREWRLGWETDWDTCPVSAATRAAKAAFLFQAERLADLFK